MSVVDQSPSETVATHPSRENDDAEFAAKDFTISKRRSTSKKPGRTIADRHNSWRQRFFWFNLVAIFLVAAAMRCWELGRMPGVNGDEAWYGVQVEQILSGRVTSWHTPTGNLLNPFFIGPQLLLHSLFGASFALLRATSVLTGIAALAVNYCLCRPIFGRRVAFISTLILAVLPINIAYSRLAWDTSQSVLFTLPALYWPLRAAIDLRRRLRWSLLSVLALAAALIVHPTNIFAGGILVMCLGYAWRQELGRWSGFDPKAGTTTTTGEPSASDGAVRLRRLLTFLVAGVIVVAMGWTLGPKLEVAARRGVDLRQYAAFALDFGHLFNGATVYEYISGSTSPHDATRALEQLLPLDMLTWLVIGWFGFGLRRRLAQRKPVDICLVFGGAIGLVGFFLIAGTGGIAPNFERYALWLIGPAALLAALACDSWFDGSRRRWATFGGLSLAWLLLFAFQCNYFEYFNRTGGSGHRTYRTGLVEPKQAAFEYIAEHTPAGQRARILTSEWWNYWPLRYLALAAGQATPLPGSKSAKYIAVEHWDIDQIAEVLDGIEEHAAGPVYIVEFSSSNTSAAIGRLAFDRNLAAHQIFIYGVAEMPPLTVFVVERTGGEAVPSKANSTGMHMQSDEVYKKIKVVDLTNRPIDIGFHSTSRNQRESCE